jgi:SH3-like domain-containing protein
MLQRLIGLLVVLLFAHSPFLQAQDTCDAIVQSAIDAAEQNCSDLSINQACLGNMPITATAIDTAEDFLFTTSGDIVPVGDLASLTSASQVDDGDGWGVAIVRLRANIESDDASTVNIVFFGDVEVENQVTSNDLPVSVSLSATANVNVRQSPVDGAVVESLTNGEAVTGIGVNDNRSWVRIEDADGNLGWVSGQFLQGDTSVLSVVAVDYQVSGLAAMQAFTFSSQPAQSDCEGIPESGLLIQVPDSVTVAQVEINGVMMGLGSTAFVRTTDDAMEVYLLEGTADVTAQETTQLMPPGTRVDIPIDAQTGIATGIPSAPQTYDPALIATLPLSLGVNAPEPIIQAYVPATPVPEENIEQAIEAIYAPQGAVTGTYLFVRTMRDPWGGGQSNLLCPANTLGSFEQYIDLATLYDEGYQRPLGEVAPGVFGDLPAQHDGITPANHSGGFTLSAKTYFVRSSTTIEYWHSTAQNSDSFGAQACRERWTGQLVRRGE